ncbi:fungal-specific transcription factor domain-containing protein [Mycena crocata]|nr:fungal-specific transcription factor domain-containing protein [Mycena crocata]
MPKDGSSDSDHSKARSRGPYSIQACVVCRVKKSKCDGVKPVCGSCGASGRNNECSWGQAVDSRKPRTEAHFEALRKRANSLQAHVDLLERMLARCVCQDVSAHVQSRPHEEQSAKPRDDDVLNPDEEIVQELTVPAQCLKFDNNLGNLLLHGITTPLRFNSRPPSEVLRVMELPEDPIDSYVLLLDGATFPDPLDWSRHLPPEVALDRCEHDKILDLSFKFLTSFSLRIVPSLFLRDMHRALRGPRSQLPPRTPHYSPMLHNALLAVSAIYSDNPYLRAPKTRQYFVNVALDRLQADCRKPDLSLVQSFAFLGTYYVDLGDRIMGDLFCGMSSRISMSLGLSVDSTTWVKCGLITHDEMRERNWAHWSVFSLDVCWALYFGRGFCGPRHRCTIPVPAVDEALDEIPWFHASAAAPPSPQPNLATLTFLESCELSVIAREIVDTVNDLASTTNDPTKIDEHVTKLDLQLNNWKSRLPPELDITPANRTSSTPHRLMLHCEYWWFHIVLHRPYFNQNIQPIQQPDSEVDHVKLCKRAAESIVVLAETWSSVYTLRYTPVPMLQVLFGAGTIYLLLALQASANGPRVAHGALQTALEQAERCVGYLHEMGRTWRCAARTGDVLHALLHDRLGPIITQRLAHIGVPLSIAAATAPLRHAYTSIPSDRNGDGEGASGFELPPPYTPDWSSRPEYGEWPWTQPILNLLLPSQSSQQAPAGLGKSIPSFPLGAGNLFSELDDMAGFNLLSTFEGPAADCFGGMDSFNNL